MFLGNLPPGLDLPDIQRDGYDCVQDDDVGEEDHESYDRGSGFLRLRNEALPAEIELEAGTQQTFPHPTADRTQQADTGQEKYDLKTRAKQSVSVAGRFLALGLYLT